MSENKDGTENLGALRGSSCGPWEDGKENQQHLTECTDDNCERCDYLTDGFYMACDSCGHWGHQEASGWVLAGGIPFCNQQCAEQFFCEPVDIE